MGNTLTAENVEVALEAQTTPFVMFDNRFCFADPPHYAWLATR